ncbi:MAG: Crp/Fnr family transcriptional regulator [Deferribacteraceae bacterium]|jgi:CRP-like cAMP-binding protein|nr:Crp/Fnr family transcriptional regulator [Deferribacteraceae bacterium]
MKMSVMPFKKDLSESEKYGTISEIIDFHTALPYFNPVIPDNLRTIISNSGKMQDVKKGSVLFYENEFIDCLLLIHSGLISVSLSNFNSNKPAIIGVLLPDNTVAGVATYINRKHVPAILTAHKRSQIISIKCHDLNRLLTPLLKEDMLRYSAQCIKALAESLFINNTATSKERLMFFYAAMVMYYDLADEGDGYVTIPNKYPRHVIRDSIYVCDAMMDRLMSDMIKKKALVREEKKLRLKIDYVQNAMDWLRNRYVQKSENL